MGEAHNAMPSTSFRVRTRQTSASDCSSNIRSLAIATARAAITKC
jgi:hypothetical protein